HQIPRWIKAANATSDAVVRRVLLRYRPFAQRHCEGRRGCCTGFPGVSLDGRPCSGRAWTSGAGDLRRLDLLAKARVRRRRHHRWTKVANEDVIAVDAAHPAHELAWAARLALGWPAARGHSAVGRTRRKSARRRGFSHGKLDNRSP